MLKEYSYKGYSVTIDYEDFNDSPRDWDNLGTMICKHRRYNLGDKIKVPNDAFNSLGELERYIYKNFDVAICLPVYAYEHGNICLNTTGFNCNFDSGQVGFIFIEKDKIRKEYGVKRISPKLKDRVADYLVNEVEIYSKYLSGEVYWFNIEDYKGNVIDSCGGFYDLDELTKEITATIDRVSTHNSEDFIENKLSNVSFDSIS